MTTRGFKEKEFVEVADIIDKAFQNKDNQELLQGLANEVLNLSSKFPLDNI